MRTSSSLKGPGFDGLHHQNTLQNAPIDQRYAEKRLVGIFARLPKILEPRMVLHLFHRYRPHLFRHQPGEPLVHRQPERADALAAKSDGRRQHQVGAIRFQQICRADVGVESLGDERDHIHERLSRLAPSAARFAISSSVNTLTLLSCTACSVSSATFSYPSNLIRSPPSKSRPHLPSDSDQLLSAEVPLILLYGL